MVESKDIENAIISSPASSVVNPADDAVFHDGTEEGKKAFLATFSAAEDKSIMRKVDRKFLLLIGLIYLIKNVRRHPMHHFLACTAQTNGIIGRLWQCRQRQGAPGG